MPNSVSRASASAATRQVRANSAIAMVSASCTCTGLWTSIFDARATASVSAIMNSDFDVARTTDCISVAGSVWDCGLTSWSNSGSR